MDGLLQGHRRDLVGVAVRRHPLKDGRVWRMRSYLEPADALEAVGLSA